MRPVPARRSWMKNRIRSRKLASKQKKKEKIIGAKTRRGDITESSKGGEVKAVRGTVAHE